MHCVTPAPLSCNGESTDSAHGQSGTSGTTASSVPLSCVSRAIGIEGIAPYEVEAGWWVRENRRNQRIATEAMRVAIGDLWSRAGVESVTAYIEEGEKGPSRRLAASLGFTMRSQGRGRFGEPMTVYELLREVWDRRGD